MEKIDAFEKDYFFLSNFYPTLVEYDGIIYSSSEAAFQAQKCDNYEDRKKFINVTASESKKMGRSVRLREDWEKVKETVMEEIVRSKFEQNTGIREALIRTGDATLIEGNWWGDKFWGVCNGEGKNKLGKILMKVREEFKNK